MNENYLIIAAIAIVFLAIVGALLYWNVQSAVDEASRLENDSVSVNVSNDTVSAEVSGNSVDVSTDSVNITSDDEGWVWSGQQEDYIKQYTDGNGYEHTIFKSSGDDLEFRPDGSVFLNGVNITEDWNKDFN
ncbi:TadE/TadG family type IV pilus assembly protein [Methanobrevibacter sp.]|uniref:TadE/TadG family type IV pilus assembly protein n=1 Tax=Methanobrevibacter sp. TaxID=66852 RepID=UPI003863447D